MLGFGVLVVTYNIMNIKILEGWRVLGEDEKVQLGDKWRLTIISEGLEKYKDAIEGLPWADVDTPDRVIIDQFERPKSYLMSIRKI